MRVIVAGSREITDINIVRLAIHESPFRDQITEIVHGGCRGVDESAGQIAQERGIPTRIFPADWDRHGKAAGPIRNGEMALYADALIAIPKLQSKGTLNMIHQMKKTGKPVFIFRE